MRVVAGKYRRRLLEWPDDVSHIRPTKDRIRESIFNALGDLSNMVALDLYAGSGAMGIEALSRNAEKAYFVDINNIALKTIKKNIESLSIPVNEAQILSIPDVKAIEYLSSKSIKIDLVIIDPPYKEGKYQETVNLLLDKNVLSESAIIVIEADTPIVISESCYSRRKDYKYGEINVAILWR